MPEDIKQLLEATQTVAVVGASRDLDKPSGHVPRDLQARGFRIVPVNPKADEILGEKAYASLAEIPGSIDTVEVFRPAEEAPDIARQAVEIGAKTLWLQLGIESAEARAIAESHGLSYVENRCMGEESARLDIRK